MDESCNIGVCSARKYTLRTRAGRQAPTHSTNACALCVCLSVFRMNANELTYHVGNRLVVYKKVKNKKKKNVATCSALAYKTRDCREVMSYHTEHTSHTHTQTLPRICKMRKKMKGFFALSIEERFYEEDDPKDFNMPSTMFKRIGAILYRSIVYHAYAV